MITMISMQTEIIPNWPTAFVSVATLALIALIAYLLLR